MAVTGCADAPSIPTSAFATPIDFTYACPGVSSTTGPSYDGSAIQEVFCDSSVAGNTFGRVLGLVLNQDPGGVLLVSIAATEAAASQGGEVIDSDPFIPGFTSIRVADKPIRILRASDWGSFYIISAGEPTVTKLVVRGFSLGNDEGGGKVIASCERSAAGAPCYDVTSFELPGTPSDGVLYGNTLLVSAAWSNEVWRYDVSTDAPSPTAVALPGTLDQVKLLETEGQPERLMATWADRGVVSLMDNNLQILDEAPIVAACSDGLDNDGDGVADHMDPDCDDDDDDDESADPGVPVVTATEPADSFAGAAFCNDGIDNDGNGLTDAEEGTGAGERCEDPAGEGLSECNDGIDNDGDGVIDTADAGCYGSADIHEGDVGPFGNYDVAVVSAGDAGTFAYVTDPHRGRLYGYAVQADTLTRLNLNAHASQAPAQQYTDTSGTSRTTPPVATTAFPGLVHNERSYLALSPAAVAMTTLQVCDGVYSTASTACRQPDVEGATHLVYIPLLNGSIAVLESVVRGVPRHRWLQESLNPSSRVITIPAGQTPRLTLRGDTQSDSDPFARLGPSGTEELAPAVENVSPARNRISGLYPPTLTADEANLPTAENELPLEAFERVPDQTWAVTFEGALPGTSGTLGRLVSATDFYAPGQHFCDHGAKVGDWLTLTVPTAGSDPLLHFDSVLTVAGGTCALEPLLTTQIEAKITAVGQNTLTVDPATARIVPQDRELDEATIRENSTNILNACQDALEEYSDELLLGSGADAVGYIAAPDQWMPALFPSRVAYTVRPDDEWTVVGNKTGYAHRWEWDGASCVENTTLDPRLNGRLKTEAFADYPYTACDRLDDEDLIVTKMSALNRPFSFTNYSFSFYMMPGCRATEGGGFALTDDRRDTRWTFTIDGPDKPDRLDLAGAALPSRIGTMETGRAIVYMDAASNRLRLFRYWHGTASGKAFSRLFD